jgi:RimJ/RimL family protein N-acetyltransferase
MSSRLGEASPGPAGRHQVGFREALPGDAEALLALKEQLDQETSFMLLEPGERNETVDQVMADLTQRTALTNSAVIVAETGTGLVGYADTIGGTYRRNRATAYLVMGVLASASGRGIGGALLDNVDRWAVAKGIHRLELTVMATNHRAIQLYERKGYQQEGIRRECLIVDGALVDELYMSKLL